MVQMKEFRIVMPMSLDEYEVAQMYMVLKMQQENTTTTEGVEVLENRPFEDNLFGKGYYTSKVYSYQSKIPSWITTFAPADSLSLKEEAWNAYPKCKSVIKCPTFTKLLLTVDTIHLADNGKSENVHGLNKDQLAMRQVEVIDIASSVRDYWSYLVGNCNVDLSKFRSARTNRGPLVEDWRGERALFLETHSNIFAWIDEWYGMNVEKLRVLEEQFYAPTKEGKMIPKPLQSKDAFDRKCSMECKEACGCKSHLKSKEQNFALAMSE